METGRILLPAIPLSYRQQRAQLRDMYFRSPNTHHQQYAMRMTTCGSIRNGIRQYCRVKLCPICTWRWSLMWQAKFTNGLIPRMQHDYPRARLLFLTLTVPNVAVRDLGETLRGMNTAYSRLLQLRMWPGLGGWVRKMEVSRGEDGLAHPHFHCLLLVHPTYFQSDYLKHAEWAALWKQSLRISHTPIVHVEAAPETQSLKKVHAWFIYLAKPGIDLPHSKSKKDASYILELSNEVYHDKVITSGGALRTYLHEFDEEYKKKTRERALLRAEHENEQRLNFITKEDVVA